MSPILKRTVSGLILVIVMVESIVASRASFIAIWVLVAALCMWEMLTLVRRMGASTERYLTIFAGLSIIVWAGLEGSRAGMVVWVIAILAMFVAELLRSGGNSLEKLGYSSLSIIYIALPIALLTTLEPMLVLTYMTVVWGGDTGAYLVGTAIGKHKMAPEISPKKSWEGFAGGVLFAVAISFLWYVLYWSNEGAGMSQVFGEQVLLSSTIVGLKWLGFGFVVAVASVAGDLLESKFKRQLGVKDSGKLIPGHGGALDRFDSIFISAPLVWCYVILVDLLAIS